MLTKTVEIEVYNNEQKLTTSIHVEQLSESIFRAIENDLFNYELTFGTEFETQKNKDGKYEVIKIIKESDFITRRFSLTTQFKESEYRLLGDEIIKQGGFWQVDFGNIVTINLHKKSNLDLEQIFKVFDFKPTEIKN